MASGRVVRVRKAGDGVAARSLREGIERIRSELGVTPDFPPEVEATAARSAAAPRLPDLDRTDLPFVTIDPPSSRDLDQAVHIERDGAGHVVHYAIADVAAFVTAGDPVDVEANRRGETLYGADSKIPLHPRSLSEGAASLLPDEIRPALLWTIRVDGTGEGTHVTVERALVRSTAKLDYESVQKSIDRGDAAETLMLLKEVGERRLHREAARGGVSLPLPEQEIDVEGDQWHLEFRSLLPAEEWNAQISLLTGCAAASLMLRARVGLLRTLPPPDPRDVERLHHTARALGIAWPEGTPYPDFIRSLDPAKSRHAAMVVACTRLLRGSGYADFDGELPGQSRHSALAAEYAHVTAPLRRLGDRYAGEVCLAICAGTEVPGWVLAKLPELPATLRESGTRAGRYTRAITDLVEAGVLQSRVGQRFAAVVVDVSEKNGATRGVVTLRDDGVEAPVVSSSALPLGREVSVRLTTADVVKRKVEFTLERG
jgi:exoribonuclease R